MIKVEQKSQMRVKQIIDKRKVKGQFEYLIEGKTEEGIQRLWLPVSILSNCANKINKFQRGVKNQRYQHRHIKSDLLKILRRRKLANKHLSKDRIDKDCRQILKKTNSDAKTSKKQVVIDIESNESKSSSQFKEMEIMKRFDCIEGVWSNVLYSKEEADKIRKWRQDFALKQDFSGVKVNSIVRQQGQFKVLYERSNNKHKCNLQDFKTYCPQLLIDYILMRYNPSSDEAVYPKAEKSKTLIWSDSQQND